MMQPPSKINIKVLREKKLPININNTGTRGVNNIINTIDLIKNPAPEKRTPITKNITLKINIVPIKSREPNKNRPVIISP